MWVLESQKGNTRNKRARKYTVKRKENEKKRKKTKVLLTQKRGADIFGDLIARPTGLRKMAQLLVQHPFEL